MARDVTDAAARMLADAYAAHAPACRLYARSLSPDAKDAAQEAFARLARRLAAGDGLPEHLRAWLMTAVRSAVLDARRRTRRRQRRETLVHPAAFAARAIFEPGAGVDAASAEAALARLPERQREVMVLRIWGDLGFETIATMIGVSTSTAHADFGAGIATLRREMGEKEQP